MTREDSPTSERPAMEASIPSVNLVWSLGQISGSPMQESAKTIGDLKGIFRDSSAWGLMNPAQEIYRVRWWSPVPAKSEGGLFWGVTVLQPGKVGDEYFMTHGHIHANRTRAEYYATVSGQGILLRMNEERETWGEQMSCGSLHYINGQHAHRVVNVGNEPLIFWACWGSDAGYDYSTVRDRGFSARVIEQNGQFTIVRCA